MTAYYNHHNILDALDFAAKSASQTCGFYGGFGYPMDLE
jgi:fructoselysine 6-kinase